MKSNKLPPREKIHEALSAIADNRVVINENKAFVSSSDGKRKYIVEWNNNIYSSNDNASYWQGYIGYPILAVLLIKGELSFNKDYLSFFKEINWKELNTKYKNNYALAVNHFYQGLESKGINTNNIDDEINKIYDQLSTLGIDTKRSNHFPPK